MLVIENLKKSYDGVEAVKNISLTISEGDIYGFLGPNGAGKTTTIRMIMGIIRPDKGLITLDGNDINAKNRQILGYLPEDRGLYQKQRLAEILYYFCSLRGINKTNANEKISLWLTRFGLENQKNRKIEELSKGNQQKVQFILSLIHNPDLIILDEPFTGLDPLNQLLLKEVIQEKQNEGKTIIFSTHQMEQVERLCNNICLINNGKIVIEGSLKNIRKKHSNEAVEVHFLGNVNSGEASKFLNDIEIAGNTLSGVLHKDPRQFISWINSNVDVTSFHLKVPSLEQIFIEEVGKGN